VCSASALSLGMITDTPPSSFLNKILFIDFS
jgi:hypothetical protein